LQKFHGEKREQRQRSDEKHGQRDAEYGAESGQSESCLGYSVNGIRIISHSINFAPQKYKKLGNEQTKAHHVPTIHFFCIFAVDFKKKVDSKKPIIYQ
jgi:hypothetical protein